MGGAISATRLIDEFISRLKTMEQNHDVRAFCELFSDHAELANMTPSHRQGRHGSVTQNPTPAQFWSQYLNAFDWIESSFTRVHDFGDNAVLEWHSNGKLAMGMPVEYSGVSLLEFSPRGVIEPPLINSFRAYFDSAALLPYAPRGEKTLSEAVGGPEIDTHASS